MGVAEGIGRRSVPLGRQPFYILKIRFCVCERSVLPKANTGTDCDAPILWSSPKPSSLKPTASIHAWEKSAMAANGFLSKGVSLLEGFWGKLLVMYSMRDSALKALAEDGGIFSSRQSCASWVSVRPVSFSTALMIQNFLSKKTLLQRRLRYM